MKNRAAGRSPEPVLRLPAMKGVRFVTDDQGNRVAVMLDLEQWGELWEDIYDNMLANARVSEPRTSLAELESQLSLDNTTNE
jgi:hypothetical protein